MPYIIGIDIGTSGTRSVLFDGTGTAIAAATREYPLLQPHNGWAEQNPCDWWSAVIETLREIMETSGVNPGDIASLGLSGQMHGLVMLDKDGKVLRPAILWCDGRTADACREVTQRVGAQRLMDITASPALTGFTAGKIVWARNQEPELYAKCRHILLPKDYIRYLLTGALATEVSDASGTQLLDIAARNYSDEVLRALDIDRALLPDVHESPAITGRVSETAAQLTGLPAGLPVAGGAGDCAASAVGVGAVRQGTFFTTIGTSGVVFAHTDAMHADPSGRVHTFCCAVPGAWHVMGVTQGAGLSLQWFRNQFGGDDLRDADTIGIPVYRLYDDIAAAIPIGAERLLYLPYLMGERTPWLDPDARGVFFGLSAMHERKHLVRAVMEGVGYSMRQCVDILRGMDVPLNNGLICGGGAKSPVWRQMLADLYGCTVSTVQGSESATLGAAILGGVGVGLYPSVPDACDACIRLKDGYAPIEANHKAYEPYYERYTALYGVLKDEFKALAAL